MSEYIKRAGIVSGVHARKHQGEFINMQVELEFKTDLAYAGYVYNEQDFQIDNIIVTLPIGTSVNAGDVIVITMEFETPFGQRFQPALAVGDENPADELDEDMLAEAADTFEDDYNEAVINASQDA